MYRFSPAQLPIAVFGLSASGTASSDEKPKGQCPAVYLKAEDRRVHVFMYKHIHTHTYIYIYICIYLF